VSNELAAGESEPPGSPISVPELRDYHQINAEVVRRLQRGERRVILEGPAGHRLLLAGLAGPWEAVIEVAGDAGPELAAGLDAPGVVVVCRGASADGAGSGLRAGSVLRLGPSATAVGYGQSGGLIVASGPVGPRAGLGQAGGELVLLGGAGPLAGDRRKGGRFLLAVGDGSGLRPEDADLLQAAKSLRDRHDGGPPAG